MPYHSSTNFYKAEQDEFERKAWEKWVNEDCKCCKLRYCSCYEFDEYYVGHHDYSSWSDTYPENFDCGAYSSCDFCYEYKRKKDRKKLIEEYYTPKEILETLKTHLQETNCWCYERVRTHILRRRVDTLLRPRRCSSVVFIPQEYRDDILTPCVIKILDKQLGQEVKILHDRKVRNEKSAILAKYGLTLEDYKSYLQRPKEEVVVETKQLPLKQKFNKVKESKLQVGSF